MEDKHSIEWLKESDWMKDLRNDTCDSDLAIDLLIKSCFLVEIYHSAEFGLEFCMEDVWVISPEYESTFWLNYFDTKKEAVNFCKEMEWTII